MNNRSDPRVLKRLLQLVAPRAADDEEMPDRFGPVRHAWQAQTSAAKTLQVSRRDLPAALVPPVEVAELDPQCGRLNFVQPAVETADLRDVTDAGAVIAKNTDRVGEFVV